jgi:Papain family cysteine protease
MKKTARAPAGTARRESALYRPPSHSRIHARRDGHGVERVLNCVPSSGRESDWPMEAAFQAGGAAVQASNEVDLRESWWDIGDQGQTGSCVGWAAADGVLRWHFVKAGLIAQAQRPSVRYVWMASKETDEYTQRPTTFIEYGGTSIKAAVEVAQRYGVVLEEVLPFASGTLYRGEASTFYSIAARVRILSYHALPTNTEATVAQWRQWLSSVGPILTRFDVDNTWLNVDHDGQLEKYASDTVAGGHAVAVVGYTNEHFIIRNSWGPRWGSGGFAYASIPYTLAAFTEAYGVVVQ